MELREKYTIRLGELNNALADFNESLLADLSQYNDQEIDWIKNAQIQKFEFSIELFWKTVRMYFQQLGLNLLSPKENIKQLFLSKKIDEKTYLKLIEAIETRNQLSHIYKKELFIEKASNLEKYLKAMEAGIIPIQKIDI